jgi:polysulfide reductase chain B
MDFHRQACVMCDNAPCVNVCPTAASYISQDGVIIVNEKKCVGCGYCITACPYKARFTNPVSKAVDKCTFCYENKVKKNQNPACVSACPFSALTFGDFNDKNSQVNVMLMKTNPVSPKKELGAKPKVLTIPNWRGGEKQWT